MGDILEVEKDVAFLTPSVARLQSCRVGAAHPSVPGMGQDLQPETRLPERVTTTVEKRKGEAVRPA
jgi:hypothetical protein